MHLGLGHRTLLHASCRCRGPVTSMLIGQQLKRCFATCCVPSAPLGATRTDRRPTLLSSHSTWKGFIG